MRKDYTIFVEGEADEHFIRQLIEFIWKGNTQITPDSIVPTNGYSNLMSMDRQQTYLNTMQRTSDDGGINLIIFDADDDCSARRKEILEWGKKNNARFELFLLPDNSGPGALEDLLERIIYPDNAPIMDCWEAYEESLRNIQLPWRNGKPLTTPAKKTKIYAYLEALVGPSNSQKEKIKEKNRDYQNPYHWNLHAATLLSLITFLKTHLD